MNQSYRAESCHSTILPSNHNPLLHHGTNTQQTTLNNMQNSSRMLKSTLSNNAGALANDQMSDLSSTIWADTLKKTNIEHHSSQPSMTVVVNSKTPPRNRQTDQNDTDLASAQ